MAICHNLVPPAFSQSFDSRSCGKGLRQTDEGLLVCPHCDLGEPRPYVSACPECGRKLRRLHKECKGCGDPPIVGKEPVVVEPIERVSMPAPAPVGGGVPPDTSGTPDIPDIPDISGIPGIPGIPDTPDPDDDLILDHFFKDMSEGAKALRDINDPKPSAVAEIDHAAILEEIGEGLSASKKYLDRVALPPDLQAVYDRLAAEIDRDTESKLAQLDRIEETLLGVEAAVQQRHPLEEAKIRARHTIYAVERQLRAVQAEYGHWLQDGSFELGAGTFDPGKLKMIESEIDFLKDVHHGIDVMCLEVTMREYGCTHLRKVRYTTETGFNFLWATVGKPDPVFRSFRGASNAAAWTIYPPISMLDAITVGSFSMSGDDMPLMVSFADPESVRKIYSEPLYSSSLNLAQDILPRLALGEGIARETSERLDGTKDFNEYLREQDERRDDRYFGMAHNMSKEFGGISRPESRRGAGLANFFAYLKRNALWFGVIFIAAIVMIIVYSMFIAT